MVGGGIVGAGVAFRLAEAGAQIVLLEAGHLCGGTSAATFAWLNANDKTPYEYYALNAAGMAEHLRLRREFDTAPWLHVDGNIEWAADGRQARVLAAKIDRLRGWGYAAEALPIASLASLEPEVRAPDGLGEFVYYADEGYVDVPVLVGTLVRAAARAGAVVRTGCRVTGVNVERGRARGVVTGEGERIDGDVVVGCAGRWTDELVALAGVRLPLAPTNGLLAISAPSSVRLSSIVHTHEVNLRADGAGRIMMRAGEFDRTVAPTTPVVPLPTACEEILARAVRVVPGLAGIWVETARVGVRPIPNDGYPAVGPVPGIDGLYVVCTHSGVTLGPLLGRLVAQELTTGRPEPRLDAYRPARLIA